MNNQLTMFDSIPVGDAPKPAPKPATGLQPFKGNYFTRIMSISSVLESPNHGDKIDSPPLCADFWRSQVATSLDYDAEKERLIVLMLNTRYGLKSWHVVSVGSLNESIAHPREIFRAAIASGAYALIVMHNHPSGDASPSEADHRLTRRLREAAELLQIHLLDHVIVGSPQNGGSGYFSFKESGVI